VKNAPISVSRVT